MLLLRAVSGQFLFFNMVNLSGIAAGGISGQISGTKIPDTNPQVLLSGNIIDVSGGVYRANLYDWDTSGSYIFYYFQASGCVPTSYMVITTEAMSGHLYGASGVAVNVYSGQLSGQPIAGLSGLIYTASGMWSASGETVVVPTSTLSGVVIASGTYPASGVFVTVPIASISGVTMASGMWPASGANVVVPIATISGVQIVSGATVSVPTSTLSGVVIASGAYPASGAFVTAAVTSGQVWLASGQAVSLNSGQSVLVYSGQLSGQPIAGLSGFIYPASGVYVTASLASGQVYLASGQAVSLNSGQSVLVYSGQLSGQVVNLLSGQNSVVFASGSLNIFVFASGVIGCSGNLPSAWGNSGTVVTAIDLDKSGYTVGTIASGILSGQPIAGLSGFIYPASGVNTVTTIASGQVYLASGQAVSLNSGQSVLVYSGQLSGQPITLLSGYSYTASGIYTTTLSGTNFIPASGQVYLASGQSVSLNSGQFVSVYSGQLSGQPIAGLSGFIYPASGVYVAGASVTSGGVYLASGQAVALNSGQFVSVYSGQLSGQPIAGLSGFIYPASGVYATTTGGITSGQVWLASGQAVALNSGQSVLVYSGQLSGQPITLLSGYSYTASGIYTTTLSGTNFIPASGQVYLASGQAVSLNSGQSVLVYSGQLSGQPIAGLSGFIYPASGVNVTATTTLVSGQVYIASGTQVVTAINLDKSDYTVGTNLDKNNYSVSSISSGILSGQVVSLLSGQAYPASGVFTVTPPASLSGITVTVPIATLSGTNTIATPVSGATYLASGSIFTTTFASGVLSVSIPLNILAADMSGVTGEAVHSIVNAMRKLICKWDTSTTSGFLTVFKENASTIAYTQAQASQSGAPLVISLGDA